MKTLKVFLVILLSVMFMSPGLGQALTVIPPVLDSIDAEPGKTYQGSYELFNETDVAQTYYFKAHNFVARGEEGESDLLTDEDQQIGLASWVKLDEPQLVLVGGDRKKVNFKIDVPADAEPGGHYAAIFATTQPPSEDVGLGENTGVLLLVTVPGDIRENAELVEFSLASGKKVYNRPPVEFLIRIKNNGNVHFKPLGDISISGWAGEKVKVDANPKRGNVLPKSIRALHPVWAGPAERGGFMQELKNEWHNFAFGRYNAHLEMEWGSNNEKFIGNVAFWVFPWRVMLVGLIILVLLILLIRGYNKAIIKKAQKQNK
ncbi:MAG: hypothetical protein ACOZBH_02365 [Patescibacteria group bacterium]